MMAWAPGGLYAVIANCSTKFGVAPEAPAQGSHRNGQSMRCLRQPNMITYAFMKSVLAPIDLSPVAADVVSEAGALAGNVGARVLLLHVVAPLAVINEYAAESERLADEETREAERSLEHWRKH